MTRPDAPVSDRGRRFAAIAHTYRALHTGFDLEGGGPYRLTSLGAWATSRAPHLFAFFRRIGLEHCRLFVDLGSGDGIAACVASLFTRSVGIEVDPELCRIARQTALRLGLEARVSFICGDFLTQRIEKADCLYLYPDKPFGSLETHLRGWRGTLLVYGPHLPPKRLTADRSLRCGRERLILYRNP